MRKCSKCGLTFTGAGCPVCMAAADAAAGAAEAQPKVKRRGKADLEGKSAPAPVSASDNK
jgi:hypothetical protein